MQSRRRFLTLGAAVLAVSGLPARALETGAARAHVEAAIDDIVGLMTSGGSSDRIADGLLGVMEQRLSLPSVARFVIGRPWNGMNEDQRARFTRAFAGSVARTYARRFSEFQVEEAAVRDTIFVLGAEDAGRKGVLVRTEIRPPNLPKVSMDYLVSDRPGKVAIVDVVIEGVSTAITQRDIIGGMLDARSGDVERLITDLDAL